MNLSSLGSFSSLATNALDTARSTFKGLAEAAVDSDSAKSPAQPAPPAPVAEKNPVAAAVAKAESGTTEAKPQNSRFGTVLDAYA
jgi:hypothetical protein